MKTALRFAKKIASNPRAKVALALLAAALAGAIGINADLAKAVVDILTVAVVAL